MRRHILPVAAAVAAALAIAGCDAELEIETGEDARETMEEHLDDEE
jgi:hypothetical protein